MRKRITFKEFNQLSLGALIEKLEAVVDKTQEVRFDFEYAFPTRLSSWRGSYAELALGYDLAGYNAQTDKKAKEPTVKELIKHLKHAIGSSYTGWKGGDFLMGNSTPLWVANDGNVGSTAIVDVFNDGYMVYLITDYCEF